MGTPWELRTATSVPRFIQYVEMNLRNKTNLGIQDSFDSPLGVPNSQVSLLVISFVQTGFVWYCTGNRMYVFCLDQHKYITNIE